ncbi:hypothetical protein ACSU1N_00015 [Thermogladius sp. 4427co]|uniref:hypothetical protein n=1 Tax=Thermogladius sp. 4427co TaxID=3450718 RepID=UPI003F79B276
MKNTRVVYEGRVSILETPAVELWKGMILVKNYMAYIGFQDEALINSVEPFILPKTLGSVCVGRVVESHEETGLTGRFIVVNPMVGGSRTVLDEDGCLSTYFQVRPERVYRVVQSPEPDHLLEPYIAHAQHLADNSEGEVLVLGCNIVGFSTSLVLYNRGRTVYMLCRRLLNLARNLGLKPYRNVNDLPPSLDTLVIGGYDPTLWDVLEKIRFRKVIVSGFAGLRYIRVPAGDEIVLVKAVDISYSPSEEVAGVLKSLIPYVKTASVKNIEDSLGYLPPRGLGVILRFETV